MTRIYFQELGLRGQYDPEKIMRGSSCIVYMIRGDDGKKYVLKLLKTEGRDITEDVVWALNKEIKQTGKLRGKVGGAFITDVKAVTNPLNVEGVFRTGLVQEYGGGQLWKFARKLKMAFELAWIDNQEYWFVYQHVVREVLKALACLHHHSYVHRDIKGCNIVVNKRTGDVKIIDLGSVRTVGREREKYLKDKEGRRLTAQTYTIEGTLETVQRVKGMTALFHRKVEIVPGGDRPRTTFQDDLHAVGVTLEGGGTRAGPQRKKCLDPPDSMTKPLDIQMKDDRMDLIRKLKNRDYGSAKEVMARPHKFLSTRVNRKIVLDDVLRRVQLAHKLRIRRSEHERQRGDTSFGTTEFI
jgi:serine/threonine protein kinase